MANDKIKHIVVLMMENRSFDHMLGFAPECELADRGTSRDSRLTRLIGTDVQVSNDANFAGRPDAGPGAFGF